MAVRNQSGYKNARLDCVTWILHTTGKAPPLRDG